MSNRFTTRAQRVILIAQEEAKRLNHNFVGAEHILLGLIALGEGVAAQVLANSGVDLRRVRSEIEKSVGTGDPDTVLLLGEIPFTPDAKKVLESAVEEAQKMGHSYVGTEHLLMGLFYLESVAKLLRDRGLTPEYTRDEILNLLGQGHPRIPHSQESAKATYLGQQLLAISMSTGVGGILLSPGPSEVPTIIILLKEGTTPDAAYMSLASVLPAIDRLRFKELGKMPVSWSNGEWKEDQEFGASLTF
jgi:ATP-dependent Clp protease ATP-binding subunit ClpA